LWVQHLRTSQMDIVALGRGGLEEARLEDYVVSGLVDFDDVSYDDHAELLYDLAGQTVRHFQSYLSEDDTRKVLRCYQQPIADFIHVQMQDHYYEDADGGYEVIVSKGFTELKPSAYSTAVQEPPADYRVRRRTSPTWPLPLRRLPAVSVPGAEIRVRCRTPAGGDPGTRGPKWFRPARGQFQIYYRDGADHREYQPDFVAESDAIYMLEPKMRKELEDPVVLAKKQVACAGA
jgi:type III restriction enzyme